MKIEYPKRRLGWPAAVGLMLLGSALALPSVSQAACTINPASPTVTVGGSIAWSVSNITGLSGSSSNYRYSWTFSGGSPTLDLEHQEQRDGDLPRHGELHDEPQGPGLQQLKHHLHPRTFTVAPQPTISINDVTVTEGQTANFTVSLSAASSQTVTVVASTANDSAVAPGDYTARSNVTVTFTPGTTTQTFAVTTINDTAVESTETFKVNLSSPTNATISDSEGVGTINDNDTAAQASLSINDVTVTEGNTGTSTMTFTVTLSAAAPTGGVTFSVATANGSATRHAGTATTSPPAASRTIAAGAHRRPPIR